MNSITCKLIDGHDGNVEVSIRRPSMQDQIAITKDQDFKSLSHSDADLGAKNQAGQMIAQTQYFEAYLIIFRHLIENIGSLDRATIIQNNLLRKLSTRDVAIMIRAYNEPDTKLVSLEQVLEVLGEVFGENAVAEFEKGLDKKLGEGVPLTSE